MQQDQTGADATTKDIRKRSLRIDKRQRREPARQELIQPTSRSTRGAHIPTAKHRQASKASPDSRKAPFHTSMHTPTAAISPKRSRNPAHPPEIVVNTKHPTSVTVQPRRTIPMQTGTSPSGPQHTQPEPHFRIVRRRRVGGVSGRVGVAGVAGGADVHKWQRRGADEECYGWTG